MAQQKEEQLRFQARLLDAVGQSVIATDLEGKILYWNRAAEDIYGWSSEEALGHRLRELTISEELVDVDRVNIDKSFLKGLGEKATDTALVRMIINLCHTLGIEVLAEGVEDSEQAALLRDMGCDLGQGNYFAEPLPGEELAQRLSTAFLTYQPQLSFE